MIKKLMLFFVVLVLLSCSASHPTIRATKQTLGKQSKVVIQTKKNASKNKSALNNKVSNYANSKVNEPLNAVSDANLDNSKTQILEATTKVKVTKAIVLDYITKYKGIAQNNMRQYGIPSSIILGQGILESGAGTGPLCTSANNHFGIKCHNDWKGASIKYDDDAAQECFRKYDEASESYKDHAVFLTNRSWYLPLFKLDKDDYKQWAKGLKNAGYATDPKYPDKLIAIIELYELNQYDSEVLGNSSKSNRPFESANKNPEIDSKTNTDRVLNSELYQVSPGDTLYSISKKFKITVDDLKQKNAMQDNAISIGQNLKIK